MRQQFGMNQKMQQRMIMTPMLQLAMKILQLSTLELKEWVEKEMTENPVLEEDNEEAPPETAGEKSISPTITNMTEEAPLPDQDINLEKMKQTRQADLVENLREGDQFKNGTWELYNESEEYDGAGEGSWGSNEDSQGMQEKRDFMEASISRAQTLAESLEWQLMMTSRNEEEKNLGKVLIGNLDVHGYLTETIENIAATQKVSPGKIEKILKLIQSFDPPGVGARDLRECLLLQLEIRKGEIAQKAYQIVRDHFEDMEKKRYHPILRALQCTEEQLREILAYIGTLEPKPGRSFEEEDTKYVTPDVSIRKIEGEYVVVLNDEPVPKLHISSYYRKLMKDKSSLGSKETKKFLEGKIQSAVWLIKNIEQRRKTIYRVTEVIFRIQREFLENGVSGLKPLTLKQVADMVGMHESTVSRVTTHKYVQTERGLFELKYFFSSGLESSNGMDVSSLSVKQKIKEMVEQESSQKPYSDQKIMQVLNGQGLSIARRTIAKYREELKIPPASQRRKL